VIRFAAGRGLARVRLSIFSATLAAVAIAAASGEAADPSPGLPQIVSVIDTVDGSPFSYRIVSSTKKTGCTVYDLTYPSPVASDLEQNNTVPAEYYLPDGTGPEGPKRPAVICLHILDGNFELVRMTCSVLAAHGVPAMMFKLPYYGERGLPEGPSALAADPALFAAALGQALADVRRAVDVLASRPEVDPRRIGVTGISLGGITAATAAALDPRIARAALILAGGDLGSIIHHARETRELSDLIRGLPAERRAAVEEAILAVDPLRHAAALRERAQQGCVLMVNAGEDEVVPRACSEKLAEALGIGDAVVWLDGLGHYTAMAELPRVLKSTAAFFAQDMPPGVAAGPPPGRTRTAVEILAVLINQAATLAVLEPQPGRCHFADLDFSITVEGKEAIPGRVSLVRGSGERFKLDGVLPEVGEVALGQGTFPWMASAGKKVVFKGTVEAAGEAAGPWRFADPQYIDRLRMLAGAAGGVALAPDILNQFCTIRQRGPSAAGGPVFEVTLTGRDGGTLEIELSQDGQAPRRIAFDAGGARGRIDVRGWQVNTVAHPAMFEPPAGSPVREVEGEDVHRVFGAALNFVMEKME